MEQGTHQSLLQRQGHYASLVNAQSLGSGKEDLATKIQASNPSKQIFLERTDASEHPKTEASILHRDEDLPEQLRSQSLLRMLGTFLGENKNLWPMYLACFVSSLIGDMLPQSYVDFHRLTTTFQGAVYPAQALLLTRLIVAFELPDDEIQAEVNFFALMFFIVAIFLLLAYACIGWITNTISQVSRIVSWSAANLSGMDHLRIS